MDGLLRDLSTILNHVPDEKTDGFIAAIDGAKRVFVYGLGRSGLVARMFGMRLVHLERSATVVGETTTPAICEDDLLVLCSRTGRSPMLHHAVSLAHRERARVAALVGLARTPLDEDVDILVRLPLERAGAETIQPMGSLFEQALHLYLDMVVLRLMQKWGKTAETMQKIHFNLP